MEAVIKQRIILDQYMPEYHVALLPLIHSTPVTDLPDKLSMAVAVYRFAGRISADKYVYEFEGAMVK